MAGTDPLLWTLKIVDEATKPAKQVREALVGVDDGTKRLLDGFDRVKKVSKTFDDVAAAMKGMKGISLDGLKQLGFSDSEAKELLATMQKLEKNKPKDPFKNMANGAKEAKSKVESFKQGFAATVGAMAHSIQVVQAVTGAITGMVNAGKGFAELVMNAAEFRRTTVTNLTALIGSKEAAEAMNEAIRSMANNAGLDTGKVNAFASDLLRLGYTSKETQDIIAAGADAAAHYGKGTEAVEGFAKAFAAMKEGGKGSLEGIQNFIPIRELKRQFDEGQRMTDQEFKAWFESGAINAVQAGDKVIDAVQRLTKSTRLGDAAANAAAESLPAQLQKVRNQFNAIIGDAALMKPITDAFGSFASMLDKNTETGKRMRAELGAAFKSIGDTVKGLATPENSKKLVDGITELIKGGKSLFDEFSKPETIQRTSKALGDLLDAVPKLAKAIGPLASTLSTVLTAVTGVGDNLRFLIAEMKRGEPVAIAFGAVLAAAFFPVTVVVGSVMAAIKAIELIVEQAKKLGLIKEDVKTLNAGFNDAGQNMIKGAVAGINARQSELKEKLAQVANDTKKAFTEPLQIRSPSKVFEKYGINTMQGFERGVESRAPAANDVVANAIDLPAARGGGVRGGGRSISITIGDINITATGGSLQEKLDDAVAQFKARLLAEIEAAAEAA